MPSRVFDIITFYCITNNLKKRSKSIVAVAGLAPATFGLFPAALASLSYTANRYMVNTIRDVSSRHRWQGAKAHIHLYLSL